MQTVRPLARAPEVVGRVAVGKVSVEPDSPDQLGLEDGDGAVGEPRRSGGGLEPRNDLAPAPPADGQGKLGNGLLDAGCGFGTFHGALRPKIDRGVNDP